MGFGVEVSAGADVACPVGDVAWVGVKVTETAMVVVGVGLVVEIAVGMTAVTVGDAATGVGDAVAVGARVTELVVDGLTGATVAGVALTMVVGVLVPAEVATAVAVAVATTGVLVATVLLLTSLPPPPPQAARTALAINAVTSCFCCLLMQISFSNQKVCHHGFARWSQDQLPCFLA